MQRIAWFSPLIGFSKASLFSRGVLCELSKHAQVEVFAPNSSEIDLNQSSLEFGLNAELGEELILPKLYEPIRFREREEFRKFDSVFFIIDNSFDAMPIISAARVIPGFVVFQEFNLFERFISSFAYSSSGEEIESFLKASFSSTEYQFGEYYRRNWSISVYSYIYPCLPLLNWNNAINVGVQSAASLGSVNFDSMVSDLCLLSPTFENPTHRPSDVHKQIGFYGRDLESIDVQRLFFCAFSSNQELKLKWMLGNDSDFQIAVALLNKLERQKPNASGLMEIVQLNSSEELRLALSELDGYISSGRKVGIGMPIGLLESVSLGVSVAVDIYGPASHLPDKVCAKFDMAGIGNAGIKAAMAYLCESENLVTDFQQDYLSEFHGAKLVTNDLLRLSKDFSRKYIAMRDGEFLENSFRKKSLLKSLSLGFEDESEIGFQSINNSIKQLWPKYYE